MGSIHRVTRGFVVDAVATLEASLQATAVRESEGGDSTVARHLRSPLMPGLTFVPSDGTGYFTYLGVVPDDLTYAQLRLYVTAIGVGVQTCEFGFFSTPLAPNRAGQTLTKIVASGSVDSMLSTGLKTNSTPFAVAEAAGAHLWGSARFSFTLGLPTVSAVANDMAQGCVLLAVACGALTGLTTVAGTVPAASLLGLSPDFLATVD